MQVRAAADATYGLDPAVIGKVEEGVLARAATQTPALFRAALRRAVAAEDPGGAEQRHAAANQDRTVRLCPLPDAMAGIWSVHTATDAEAIYARLRELTATPADPEDVRGVDERRADTLRDLDLGGLAHPATPTASTASAASAGARIHVQLLIPAAVADATSDAPGAGRPRPDPRLALPPSHAPAGTVVERIHLDTADSAIASARQPRSRNAVMPPSTPR
jgi:hypothetical protein